MKKNSKLHLVICPCKMQDGTNSDLNCNLVIVAHNISVLTVGADEYIMYPNIACNDIDLPTEFLSPFQL